MIFPPFFVAATIGAVLPTSMRTLSRKGLLLRSRKGFTLIELIAVIVVLGILAAYIVPRYTGFLDNALTASAKSAASEGVTRLQGASQLFAVDTSHPPSELSDISNSTYLNLDADNAVNVGGFVVKYTPLGGTPPQIQIQVFDATGTTQQHSVTLNWP